MKQNSSMTRSIATASRLLLVLILASVVVRQPAPKLFSTSPITPVMAFSIRTMSINKKMFLVTPLHSITMFHHSSPKNLMNQLKKYNTATCLSIRTLPAKCNVERKGKFRTTNRRWNSQNNKVQNLQSTANNNDQGVEVATTMIRSSDDTHYDTKMDEEFLQMAVDAAQLGYGYTFPNPAVGCIIVLTTTTTSATTATSHPEEVNHTIIGRGYHPRAGYPHAEIFALLEAAKHVPCGIQAATSVNQHYNYYNKRDGLDYNKEQGHQLYETVVSLTKQYQSENGTRLLFENCLQPHLLPNADGYENEDTLSTTKAITAYVTLEPCCHTGKRTPPCTNSLLASNGISRIVVGSRDPNPQVDGGGIHILQQQHDHSHSTKISIVDIPRSYYSIAGTSPYNCNALITNFAKRITVPTPDYELSMTGRVKRVLRTLASQMLSNNSKNSCTLPTVSWGSYTGRSDKNGSNMTVNFSAASVDIDELLRSDANDMPGVELNKNALIEKAVNELEILQNWLEHLDGILWQHELVLLRLNKAVSKRKGTTLLGNRIAQQLKACVVQTKGHTVLLYRPSSVTNPIIDVQNLLSNDDGNDAAADVDENES